MNSAFLTFGSWALRLFVQVCGIWIIYALLPIKSFEFQKSMPFKSRAATHLAIFGALSGLGGALTYLWIRTMLHAEVEPLYGTKMLLIFPREILVSASVWGAIGFFCGDWLEKRSYSLPPLEAILFAVLALAASSFGGTLIHAFLVREEGLSGHVALHPFSAAFIGWVFPSLLWLLLLCAFHRWGIRRVSGIDLPASESVTPSAKPSALRAIVTVAAWVLSLAGAALIYIVILAGAMKSVPSLSNSELLMGMPLAVIALILSMFSIFLSIKSSSALRITLVQLPPFLISTLSLVFLGLTILYDK